MSYSQGNYIYPRTQSTPLEKVKKTPLNVKATLFNAPLNEANNKDKDVVEKSEQSTAQPIQDTNPQPQIVSSQMTASQPIVNESLKPKRKLNPNASAFTILSNSSNAEENKNESQSNKSQWGNGNELKKSSPSKSGPKLQNENAEQQVKQ